ncbi:DUF1796 protein [Fadolivirus algeromassiliense]|jgi:hypothetical protein|uniref:DUF1796 protein n=1 Tax=Fadolivirus FV1/VV64 TaxID=3070911 RepID=A0A7D3QVM6_9VIRU|nr:DUF1796 protein [Fadolivirus algeromassiliense]QKF94424.1 DUF1796 protein [Fadolivirus FV1/VV64]
MEYISIGNSCSVTYQKQQLDIKNETYPFDWIRTESLDDITNCINNDFIDFITNLIKVNESDKFPVSSDDNFPDNSDCKSIIMKNRYGMKFYHDFNNQTNMSDIVNKYERRIKRFINLIKSNKSICFVRDELKPIKINNGYISNFINVIKKINSECNCKIVIILHKPKNNHELLRNNVNKEMVDILIDNNEFGDWFRPNIDWKTVFNI